MSRHLLTRTGILSLLLVLASSMALFLPPASPHMAAEASGAWDASRYGTEVEPNNELSHATPLASGGPLFANMDQNLDPVDWFRIWVPRGLTVNVTVTMDEGMDLDGNLEIHFSDAQGDDLVSWSRTQYRFESVCLLSAMDQEFHIKVTAASGSGGYVVGAYIEDVPALRSGDTAYGTVFNDTINPVDFYKVWLEARPDGTADRLSVHMVKSEAMAGVWPGLELEVQRLDDWSTTPSYYDLAWGHEGSEDVAGTATVTGWYYIRVFASNSSGSYMLTVAISGTVTDGDGDPSSSPSVYGPDIDLQGTLSQSEDQIDAVTIYLEAGEGVQIDGTLYWVEAYTLFLVTLTDSDLHLIGQWSDVRTDGALLLLPEVHGTVAGTAIAQGGYYHIILQARSAVEGGRSEYISQENGQLNYDMHIRPSGHNTAPMPISDNPTTLSMAEDTALDLDVSVLFSDPDTAHGDVLSFQVSSWNASYKVTGQVTDGRATVTPPPDVCGEWGAGGKTGGAWGLTIRALDKFKAMATMDMGISVGCMNDAPFLTNGSGGSIEIWMNEDTPYIGPSLRSLFTDPDTTYMDRLTFDIIDNGTLPVSIIQNGSMVLGPATGAPGDRYMTVTATDMGGLMASVVFLVHVAHISHAPVVSMPVLTVMVPEDGNATVDLDAIFSDIEDLHLSYTWSGNVNTLLVLRGLGTLEASAPLDWNGDEDVVLKGTDSEGLSTSLVLHIHVISLPDPPTIVNAHPEGGNATVRDGGTISFWVSVMDPDRKPGISSGDTIYYTWSVDGRTMVPRTQDHDAYVLSPEGLDPGVHDIDVLVTDSTGNRASWHWSVVVEGRPANAGTTPLASDPATGAAAATTASVGIWALAVLFLSEHGRYAFLKLLFIPLYSKIRKEQVLDHFTRGRIFGFIESHPGCNYTQIKAHVGVGNGTLTHHLATLEREAYVRSERDGLHRRFYPAGAPVVGDIIELSMIQREIFALVKLEPGISQAELAKRIGVSRRVINYHVKMLEAARLMRLEHGPKKTYCYVIEPEGGAGADGTRGAEEDEGHEDGEGKAEAPDAHGIGGGKAP